MRESRYPSANNTHNKTSMRSEVGAPHKVYVCCNPGDQSGTTSTPLSVVSKYQNRFPRASFHSRHRIHLIIPSTTMSPNQKPTPSQSNRINRRNKNRRTAADIANDNQYDAALGLPISG